ncbi:uncharacterized protein (DUF305 family) [Pseudorhizobium tarimense]|uniref:Uncharacterized protein (DUF305 family) n=1 Tax=Pseudorhizobium tarimense TaxID=1079109 RepID=A0ABV2H769_9HYPH|nr:DUF305 domain-containing protein [Pseudorhizobium tarimense]MCJ8519758.1 DUF305 domain-containing protein [Pseudorhizobium tarimense]
MNTFAKTAAAAALALAGPATHAAAQQVEFPEKCRSDISAGGTAAMDEMMPSANMTDYQHGYMEGMKKMMPNMMHGIMKDDADVAFICGMIAHHMGSIAMARVELEHGDNDYAKETAQKMIDRQIKDIQEMSDWVEQEVK